MDTTVRLLAVLGLVLMNGFFVAAEFALVSARATRINQLAEEGNWSAKTVQKAMNDPNRFISACQVGITLASLALGWIAEPAIGHLIDPALARVFGESSPISARLLSAAIALFIVTLLHIVIGEQVPKMIALQRSERTVLVSAPVVSWISVPFRPIIALLYWLTDRVLGLLGLHWEGEHSLVYTEDELKMLVTASQQSGYLEPSEQEMIERVFQFADIMADEVMVPRTELVALAVDASYDEVLSTVLESGHSRFPAYREDLDEVIGIFFSKDLLRLSTNAERRDFQLRQWIRPAVFVPEHMPLDELLATMRAKQSHAVIVVDEYGGTAGLVTLEDVMERIVGDVDDGPSANGPDVQELANGVVRLSGMMAIHEVNEQFGTHIDDPFYNSLGGFVFGQIGRRPAVGDEIAVNGHILRVAELDGLRIDRIDLEPAPLVQSDSESAPTA
ncbi:MAG: HlyC/CorC family transporter [Thermomicrobiales bacterium]|nr:MAG: HlyC/CorC family transporter [Thermomicrobiales bacterium]